MELCACTSTLDPGKTTVLVMHDAQLLLNKQQQIWA